MRRLGDKIPVEPLDEVRLARIERAVVDELAVSPEPGRASVEVRSRGSALRWVWPSVAVACAAALAFVMLRGTGTSESSVVVNGGLGGSSLELERAVVALDAGTRVRVFERGGVTIRVELERGEVACEVAKRPGAPEFVVVAGSTRVVVVGTAFTVKRRGEDGEQVEVRVTRGVVRVEHGEDEVVLRGGDGWRSPEMVAPAGGEELGQGRSPEAGAEVGDPVKGASYRGGGALVAPGGNKGREPASSTTDDRGPTTDDRGPTTDDRRPTTDDRGPSTEHRASRTDHRRPRTSGRQAKTGQSHAAASLYSAPGGLDPIMRPPDPSPRAAERHLRSLSLRTGDEAAYALYSLAHWQLYRLRDPSAAAKSAERYERRFRRGDNAESALWVRIAALCAAERESRCRAAAHSYTRRYPGGRFSRYVKTIVNRR